MIKPIRRLPIKDVDAVLRAYYGTGYIGNKEISKIFGTNCSSTMRRLKKPVEEVEIERNIPKVVPNHLNVKVAFEVWGIDVPELERNRKKLQQLNLAQEVNPNPA